MSRLLEVLIVVGVVIYLALVLIGVFLVYCAKSFFETRESEKVRMEEMKMETGSEEPESEEMEEIEL